jgi:hypothetical protein
MTKETGMPRGPGEPDSAIPWVEILESTAD